MNSKHEYIPLSQSSVKIALGQENLTRYGEFYAYCCADILECVFLNVQIHLNRRSYEDIPGLLLIMASNACLTKWHYWTSVAQFTSLLDSPLQVIDFNNWKNTAKFVENDQLLHRILRFGELFVFLACVPQLSIKIGAHQIESLKQSYDYIRRLLSGINKVPCISDFGDRHAEVRSLLYTKVLPQKIAKVINNNPDMLEKLPELAHFL